MSNEITIVVKSDNRAKPGMDEVGRDTDRLKARAKALGAEFQRASQQTDEFGRRLHGTGTFTDFLGAKIGKLREETHRLTDEFQRTGHTDFGKLFGNIDESKDLKKLRDRLTSTLAAGAVDGAKAVENALSEAGQGASKGFWGTFSSLPPEAQAGIAGGIAAVVAATAPFLGAAINGVLLAGVAAGGLALGIAGQMHDPRIEAATSELGAHLKESLTSASAPLGPVLLAGIQRMDAALSKAVANLAPAFAHLAPVLDRLFSGLEGFIANVLPGFSHAIDAGGKVLARIGDDLPGLGQAFSRFFDLISNGADGASDAMHYLFVIIEGTVLAVGVALETLSKNFQQLELLVAVATGDWAEAARVLNEMRGGAQQAGPALAGLGAAAGQSADDFARLSSQISHVAMDQDRLAGQMTDRLLDSLLGTAHATLGFEEALTRASDAIKQNGKTLDIHSARGQQNAEAILGMVEANKRLYDQNIANGMSMVDAAGKWDLNTQRIYAWGQQVGIGKGQLDGMIGSMKDVPDEVNTRIVLTGIEVAIERLDTLLRRINGLPYSKEIHVNTVLATISGGAEKSAHHAAGGIWGGLTTLAEQGRELVRLPQGSMVLSNPDTERVLAGGQARASEGSAGGGRTVFFGPGIDSAFASYFQQLVATGQISIN